MRGIVFDQQHFQAFLVGIAKIQRPEIVAEPIGLQMLIVVRFISIDLPVSRHGYIHRHILCYPITIEIHPAIQRNPGFTNRLVSISMCRNAAVLNVHEILIHLALGYQIGQVCGSDTNGDRSLRDTFRECPDLSAVCCAPVKTITIAAHAIDIQFCINWLIEACGDVIMLVRAIITAESAEFLFP